MIIIAVNILGFFLYLLNMLLYTNVEYKKTDSNGLFFYWRLVGRYACNVLI